MLQKSHHSSQKVHNRGAHFSGSKTKPFSGLIIGSTQRSLKQNQWFCNRLWTMLVQILRPFSDPPFFYKTRPVSLKNDSSTTPNLHLEKLIFIFSNSFTCESICLAQTCCAFLFWTVSALQGNKAKQELAAPSLACSFWSPKNGHYFERHCASAVLKTVGSGGA